ncbi:fasciclin domain-containing protein [Aquirufa aurantiipilula]|uniref:Fasciclin domain-containing protein n=1 Tax=Aquirufa aurantiipilula TaxID=2696561 RepID=A0ABT6BKN2_9BACT|nr:fasciclin domain-containing protein [Aquirufa aurantiipilula]MBZ1327622.1 fasciclin domain-containing protein [Aquirufa aurantiipilula]MDF5691029.1 fasciclin domain-containing protein [Aquirufa aurantiipilula]
MKVLSITILAAMFMFTAACSSSEADTSSSTTETAANAGGQENVKDDDSQQDVVKVAVGSKDHTTLVAALKQADLVTSLSNAGPFTVFAPTNAAFDKVDKATLTALMTDEKKADLQNILQYHVTVSALKADYLQDGQVLGMVNGDNVTVSIKNGKIMLNNSAAIIASVPASNGIIHVIDGVLLPPSK